MTRFAALIASLLPGMALADPGSYADCDFDTFCRADLCEPVTGLFRSLAQMDPADGGDWLLLGEAGAEIGTTLSLPTASELTILFPPDVAKGIDSSMVLTLAENGTAVWTSTGINISGDAFATVYYGTCVRPE